MAAPITKTWLEMQLLSGGSTCRKTKSKILPHYPGITDATVIDALEWCEFHRDEEIIRDALPGMVRLMSGAQKKTLIVWGLGRLQANLPVGWVRTPAIDAKIDEMIDLITAPTAAKRVAMQIFASDLDIDFSDVKDRHIADFMKRAANMAVAGEDDHADVSALMEDMFRAATRIAGLDKQVVLGAILTKMEKIHGIID